MSVTNKPAIEAYIGAGGSGKGVSINRRLQELAPRRLLLWDPRAEYGKHAPAVSSLPELVRLVSKAGKGPFRLRFVPGGAVKLEDAFGLVCKVAFTAGNLCFVAEELSDVTKPSFAPPAWRRITTQGRHQGLHVLGAAQRPALIDKTFLANCTRVRCFQLGYDSDIEAMAKELRAPAAAVAALVTRDTDNGADIAGLEYHRRTRELFRVAIKVSAAGVREKVTPYVPEAPSNVVRMQRRQAGPT